MKSNAPARRILDFGVRTRRAVLAHQRGRIWALRATLASPARAAREAWRAVRKHGRVTAADAAVPLSRQFAWTWWLSLRYDYEAYSTYRYRLFSRDRAFPVPLFAQWPDMEPLFVLVAACGAPGSAETLADKRRFARWCTDEGIPTPPILLEFEDGRIAGGTIAAGGEARCDIFAKWGADFGGNDTSAWRFDGSRYVDHRGIAHTFDAVLASLAERSKRGVVLLQPRLVNHHAIRDLSHRALSTVRVMTLCGPGERPRVLAALLRMGTGESTADNFAQGGIASEIDLLTGRSGPARSLDKQFRTHVHEVHPDTGAAITGRGLPFWEESVRLALDAHARLGPIACIGWDVAILDDGPVLLEGNWNPSTKLLQVVTQEPLLATEFGDVMAAWLGTPACQVDDAWIVRHHGWKPV